MITKLYNVSASSLDFNGQLRYVEEYLGYERGEDFEILDVDGEKKICMKCNDSDEYYEREEKDKPCKYLKDGYCTISDEHEIADRLDEAAMEWIKENNLTFESIPKEGIILEEVNIPRRL